MLFFVGLCLRYLVIQSEQSSDIAPKTNPQIETGVEVYQSLRAMWVDYGLGDMPAPINISCVLLG